MGTAHLKDWLTKGILKRHNEKANQLITGIRDRQTNTVIALSKTVNAFKVTGAHGRFVRVEQRLRSSADLGLGESSKLEYNSYESRSLQRDTVQAIQSYHLKSYKEGKPRIEYHR